MRGVSEVIAIILILMITISLAGLAYMFMSTTMADVTSSAGSTVDTTTSSMMTSFKIETMDVAKVYVRNTGQNALTSLSVYINDAPAHFNMTPSSISAGQIGTITIYDFIAEDDTIKITSPSGFSTSKKAPDPCDKAVVCYKLDENSGTTAYDSSPSANHGTLTNGPVRTTGIDGGAVSFDGVNDFLVASTSGFPVGSDSRTLCAWLKANRPYTAGANISIYYGPGMSNGLSFGIMQYVSNYWYVYLWGVDMSSNVLVDYNWHYHCVTYDGSTVRYYYDGTLTASGARALATASGTNFYVGGGSFNGTIDDVRLFNRVIY